MYMDRWTLTERLEDIYFAGDLTLMTVAEAARDMQESLRLFLKYAGQVRLKFSAAKTKLMRKTPLQVNPDNRR